MAMATVAGMDIRHGLITEHPSLGRLGQVDGNSATTYLSDPYNLKGISLPSALFEGARLRISVDAAGSPTLDGEEVWVDYLDQDNGRLYVTPATSAALSTTASKYEVWLNGLNPNDLDRLRDDLLTKYCSMWRIVPVSVITDGDLESSGVTSWTAAGGATRAKAFATFPDVFFGRRQLSVVHTTAATDYVKSASIYVRPGEEFFFECSISAYVTATGAAAVGKIIVRDITNGANVTLSGLRTSHTGRGWGKLNVTWTVPDDCYEIQVWLQTETASSTTVWGPMNCHRQDAYAVPVPDRIKTKKFVGDFFTLGDVATPSGFLYDSQRKLVTCRIVEKHQVGTQVKVALDPAPGTSPLFFYERGFFDALSTDYQTTAQRKAGDDATTDCPKEYIVAALAERVLRTLKERDGERWASDYERALMSYNYWEGVYGPEPRLQQERSFYPSVPQLKV